MASFGGPGFPIFNQSFSTDNRMNDGNNSSHIHPFINQSSIPFQTSHQFASGNINNVQPFLNNPNHAFNNISGLHMSPNLNVMQSSNVLQTANVLPNVIHRTDFPPPHIQQAVLPNVPIQNMAVSNMPPPNLFASNLAPANASNVFPMTVFPSNISQPNTSSNAMPSQNFNPFSVCPTNSTTVYSPNRPDFSSQQQIFNSQRQNFDSVIQNLDIQRGNFVNRSQNFSDRQHNFVNSRQKFHIRHEILDNSSQNFLNLHQNYDISRDKINSSRQNMNDSRPSFDTSQQIFNDPVKNYDNSRQIFNNSNQKYDNSRQNFNNSNQKYDNSRQIFNNSNQKYDNSRHIFNNSNQKYDDSRQNFKFTSKNYDDSRQNYNQQKPIYNPGQNFDNSMQNSYNFKQDSIKTNANFEANKPYFNSQSSNSFNQNQSFEDNQRFRNYKPHFDSQNQNSNHHNPSFSQQQRNLTFQRVGTAACNSSSRPSSQPHIDHRNYRDRPLFQHNRKKEKNLEFRKLKDDNVEKPFSCDTCDRSFVTKTELDEHLSLHITCDEAGCTFKAHPKVVALHKKMQHDTGYAEAIFNLKSDADIQKWREERRRRFPTAENIKKRQAEQAEREARGEVLETKDFGKFKRQRNDGRDNQNRNRRRQRNNRYANNRDHPLGKQVALDIASESDSDDDSHIKLKKFKGIPESSKDMDQEEANVTISSKESGNDCVTDVARGQDNDSGTVSLSLIDNESAGPDVTTNVTNEERKNSDSNDKDRQGPTMLSVIPNKNHILNKSNMDKAAIKTSVKLNSDVIDDMRKIISNLDDEAPTSIPIMKSTKNHAKNSDNEKNISSNPVPNIIQEVMVVSESDDSPVELPIIKSKDNLCLGDLHNNHQKKQLVKRDSFSKIAPKQPPIDALLPLYKFSNDPERKIFLDKLVAFQNEKGKPLMYCPTMSKRHLDLYKLYTLVKEKGGFTEAFRERKWNEISDLMGFGKSSGAAFALKKLYQRFLLAFECKYDRDDIDIRTLLRNLRPDFRRNAAKIFPSNGDNAVPAEMNGQTAIQNGTKTDGSRIPLREGSQQNEQVNGYDSRHTSLLERVLADDIRHERNVILQCIRYIVNKNFFEIGRG